MKIIIFDDFLDTAVVVFALIYAFHASVACVYFPVKSVVHRTQLLFHNPFQYLTLLFVVNFVVSQNNFELSTMQVLFHDPSGRQELPEPP